MKWSQSIKDFHTIFEIISKTKSTLNLKKIAIFGTFCECLAVKKKIFTPTQQGAKISTKYEPKTEGLVTIL